MNRALHLCFVALALGAFTAIAVAGCFAERQLSDVVGAGGSGGTTGDCTTECCMAEDCPLPIYACVTRICENGKCSTKGTDAGKPIDAQVPGDCKVVVCNEAGETAEEIDNSDALDDGNDCTIDSCASGIPSTMASLINEPCNDNRGKVCDGLGTCVECNTSVDCTESGKALCLTHVCVNESCLDGAKNGSETDEDCGGVDCPKCADGDDCTSSSDCQSNVCTNSQCQIPACDDTAKNGSESDVDCGGSCPASCKPNQACNQNSDCMGNQCINGTCVPNCNDETLNNMELETDCGGPKCGDCDGENCLDDQADCKSGHCFDGVCCDKICDGTCEACTAALTGQPSDGVCGPVSIGVSDNGECMNEGGCGAIANKCLCQDGMKDGTEKGIDCAGPCLNACPNGTPCGVGFECSSNACVDGFCCPMACGECKTCSDQGTCVELLAGSLSSCMPDLLCDGAGLCKVKNGKPCAQPSNCLSNFCDNMVCSPCGSTQDCSNAVGNKYDCRAGACRKKTNEPCILDIECFSYNCSNGKCASCIDNDDCASKSCIVVANNDNRCLYQTGMPCAAGANCASNICTDANADGQFTCGP